MISSFFCNGLGYIFAWTGSDVYFWRNAGGGSFPGSYLSTGLGNSFLSSSFLTVVISFCFYIGLGYTLLVA